MSTLAELQAKARTLLSTQAPPPPIAVTPSGVEGLGAAIQAFQRFTVFIPHHLLRALELAAEFMRLANAQPGDEGLEAALKKAEEEMGWQDPELVKYALRVFITHHPEARRLPLPPLFEREPTVVLPSRPALVGGNIEALGAFGPEAKLDWFREDIWLNEHHERWHQVYPGGGHPNPAKPNDFITKDRQGELFWYMHQQMLARYDTERLSLGLSRVEPYDDFNKPIVEGYDANLPRYSNRSANARPPNFPDVYTINDHTERKNRLLTAARTGTLLFPDGQTRSFTDASALANALESNTDSPEENNWQALRSHYGTYHNVGHGLIGALATPQTQNRERGGVMNNPATAMRDPIFYRWHRHIDDVMFAWQETLPSHDFADAPQVLIRKSIGGGPAAHQSPDILLCSQDGVPGATAPGFDGQAFGEQNFGGANWDKAPSEFPQLVTDQLRTFMRQFPIQLPNGNTVQTTYLDHEDFFYFLRLQNLRDQEQKVTVRIFLAAQAFAEDRRQWIEMDKFVHTLSAGQKAVVFRSSRMASVVRRPGLHPVEPRPAAEPGQSQEGKYYCDCGWPYHLLLPRGTSQGMEFRLMVMLTDWGADKVSDSHTCGSMSFCGAKDAKYPDKREMGYPFNRPLPQGKSISDFIQFQQSIASCGFRIKHG